MGIIKFLLTIPALEIVFCLYRRLYKKQTK